MLLVLTFLAGIASTFSVAVGPCLARGGPRSEFTKELASCGGFVSGESTTSLRNVVIVLNAGSHIEDTSHIAFRLLEWLSVALRNLESASCEIFASWANGNHVALHGGCYLLIVDLISIINIRDSLFAKRQIYVKNEQIGVISLYLLPIYSIYWHDPHTVFRS